MGAITSCRAPVRRSPRPTVCPADVDQQVWFAAYHSLGHVDRITLDDLLDDDSEIETDPTPDEIEVACVVIRSTWSPAETRRRQVQVADMLTAAVIRSDDLLGALADV